MVTMVTKLGSTKEDSTCRKMGKRKGDGYQHKVTINSKARESEERRAQQFRSIEVKRLQNNLEKIRQTLLRYPKSGVLNAKKQKLDPLYDLKGAARPGIYFIFSFL